MWEKLLLAIGLTFSLSIFTKINLPSQKQAVQAFDSVEHQMISQQVGKKKLN
ncbi:MAG: hypothetical protein IGS39_13720 [Calothrix sp. C42_A2020_038]|nr:hypothetical protein [Calothrix sp. C42_A2020_038]